MTIEEKNDYYKPMVQTYSKRTDNREAFKYQAFRKFVDACGGDLEEFTQAVYNRFTIEDFSLSDDCNYAVVLRYFQDVAVPHKIAVYQAGIELMRNEWFKKLYIDQVQFIENLWLHDNSKFSAEESFGYAFASQDFKKNKGSIVFQKAWNHHQKHNMHHPEYWHQVNRDGSTDILPMPIIYLLEMVADWIGAGKTYGSTIEEWLPNNLTKFKFHNQTLNDLKWILENLGFEVHAILANNNYLLIKK
jgi:hypothetical protein